MTGLELAGNEEVDPYSITLYGIFPCSFPFLHEGQVWPGNAWLLVNKFLN